MDTFDDPQGIARLPLNGLPAEEQRQVLHRIHHEQHDDLEQKRASRNQPEPDDIDAG
jgi:hypothetical protein